MRSIFVQSSFAAGVTVVSSTFYFRFRRVPSWYDETSSTTSSTYGQIYIYIYINKFKRRYRTCYGRHLGYPLFRVLYEKFIIYIATELSFFCTCVCCVCFIYYYYWIVNTITRLLLKGKIYTHACGARGKAPNSQRQRQILRFSHYIDFPTFYYAYTHHVIVQLI